MTRSFWKRFVSSLSDEIGHAIICSPYFDGLPEPFKEISGFCRHLRTRGVKKIEIITRPPGKANAMTIETAKFLMRDDVDIYIRTQPYLHAKMYHFEYVKGYFRNFVGSSNFTIGGLERNDELMAEFEGVGNETPCHREIARLRDKGAFPYSAWVNLKMPEGVEETT
ncbi:phospholipase D-like domain-containing protein [Mesorhizobium sp. M0119]|uniref:phospholipase D-like domain-containing protein n=1 Tax=Mesorhizobium sp. M0119 TaxID=2956885 RepID=UPI00333C05E4